MISIKTAKGGIMKKRVKASVTKVIHWVCDNCGADYDEKDDAMDCPCWADEMADYENELKQKEEDE